jgi:hypothetical protein
MNAPYVLVGNDDGHQLETYGYAQFDYGWEVAVGLPLGITPASLEGKKDELGHAMGVDRVDIISTGPRRVTLRFFTKDPLQAKPGKPAAVPELKEYEVGIYDNGEPMLWDPSISAHQIVIGQTRSGKSSYLRTLLLSLPDDTEVSIADFKRVEFGNYKVGGKVVQVATKMGDIADMFEAAEAEMLRRLDLMVAGDVNHFSKLPGKLPHRVMLFDELMAAYSSADNNKANRPLVDRTRASVAQLGLLGGAAGFSVILGIHQPEASLFGSSGLRDQFRAVVALRHVGGSGVGMAFQGQDVSKVEGMFDGQQGHGVCVGLAESSEPRRFRSHFVDEKVTRHLVTGQ